MKKTLALAALTALTVAPAAAVAAPTRSHTPAVPKFSHIVEVMLENESATATFENATAAPHLGALRKRGVYLPHFYGVGHNSLDNYLATFGGVQPTADTKADCIGRPFSQCVYPGSVKTLGALLDAKHYRWKVYSEGMLGVPGGHNCLAPSPRSIPDPYQGPDSNGYATRHNPAPWFGSVLNKGGSDAYCRAHSVDLTQFWKDTTSPKKLPRWSFIEPDTCHDGHDGNGCMGDPEGPSAPSGVAAIDKWLPGFVHRLTHSKAWDSRSLLVITFDEGAGSDTAGCAPCHDTSAGGRIGALLIGHPLKHPGTVDRKWYGDHYAWLRTVEKAWGLPTLKSKAASKAAAKTVHDGDPHVHPLTGIWRT